MEIKENITSSRCYVDVTMKSVCEGRSSAGSLGTPLTWASASGRWRLRSEGDSPRLRRTEPRWRRPRPHHPDLDRNSTRCRCSIKKNVCYCVVCLTGQSLCFSSSLKDFFLAR